MRVSIMIPFLRELKIMLCWTTRYQVKSLPRRNLLFWMAHSLKAGKITLRNVKLWKTSFCRTPTHINNLSHPKSVSTPSEAQSHVVLPKKFHTSQWEWSTCQVSLLRSWDDPIGSSVRASRGIWLILTDGIKGWLRSMWISVLAMKALSGWHCGLHLLLGTGRGLENVEEDSPKAWGP